MKGKRLLSGLISLGMVVSAFPGMVLNAGAETALENGAYVGPALLAPGQYLHSDGTTCTDGSHTHDFDDEACRAYMADGELTLWGQLDITETPKAVTGASVWGGISGGSGGRSFKITLRPGADINISSGNYSGIYGNYEAIYIQGDGKISINTSGSSEGGLFQYGNYNAGKNGITITDGADVSITGTEGVGIQSVSTPGEITVTDGATLTVDVTGTSFSQEPVIQEGSTVTVGDSEGTAAAWDGETPLTSYKYVKIEAPGSTDPAPEVTPDPGSEATPEPDPTEEPTSTEEPSSTDEPSSVEHPTNWVGVQVEKDGNVTWYYNNHYMMQDGKCYTSLSPYPGFEKGMETMYYTKEGGLLEFSHDVTLYGVKESLGLYYGTGLATGHSDSDGTDLVIHLNNNANVTIDATDRGTASYLYGLYSMGELIIEGNGTLTIKSDGGTSDNAALCIYNNSGVAESANLTIKDNVKLILENTDANGYGILAYGNSVGNITIEDNAYVEMTGGKAAISQAPVINGNQKVYAGSSAGDAEVWDGVTDIASYKYVRIADDTIVPEPTATATAEADTTPAPTPEATPSVTPAPTEAPQGLPTSGVIFYDDYEDIPAYDWEGANISGMSKRNGGNYNNVFRMKIDFADGHGKVFNADTGVTDAVGFYYSNKDLYDLPEEQDTNSGTLVISADYMIPSGFEFNGESNTAIYMMSYSGAGWSAMEATKEYSYLYRINIDNGASSGEVTFGDSDVNYIPKKSSSNTATLEFDKWYNIAVVIDYDRGNVGFYVDGKWITSSNVKSSDIEKYYAMSYLTLTKGNTVYSDNPPIFSLDNFKIAYDSEELPAEITEVGTDYVNVKFDRPIYSGSQINVSLSPLDGSSAVTASSVTAVSADTLRVSFGSGAVESSKSYELVFDSGVSAAYGSGKIDAGDGVIFTAPAAKQVTELINMDFEDVNLTAENSSAFDDFVLIHQNAENTEFVDDSSRTYDYVSTDGGVLAYDHYMDVENEKRNGLKFPFKNEDGEPVTVDKGILTVEFDACVSGDAARTRALYGFNDPAKTDATWSSATVFGGIAPYSGNRMSFTKASTSYRNKLSTDSSMDMTIALNNAGDMHHYKYVIDLDNNTYKIYYDYSLAADLDYIPGGAEDNSFDAFVMSAMFGSDSYSDRGTSHMMLDNLKVTAEVSSPAVSGMTFVKYDNTESDYSRVVPSGTQQIKIAFTKDMAENVADYITVSGMAAEDYDVSYANGTAVIDFNKYFAPSTSYTVTIGAQAASADGGTVGTDIVYTFSTDSGEIVYNKPVIKVNGAVVSSIPELSDDDVVTAELTVINTTGAATKCWMSLAGYDNENCLTSLTPLDVSAEASQTSTVVLTADTAELKDAGRIGVFVFDDLATIRPLTESTKIEK